MSIDIIFRKFFWASDAIEHPSYSRAMTPYGREVGILTLGIAPKNKLCEELISYNGAFNTVKIIIRDYGNIHQQPLREWVKLCNINESEFDRYIKQVYIETLQRKRREDMIKSPKYKW
jgi:hypothetical protein